MAVKTKTRGIIGSTVGGHIALYGSVIWNLYILSSKADVESLGQNFYCLKLILSLSFTSSIYLPKWCHKHRHVKHMKSMMAPNKQSRDCSFSMEFGMCMLVNGIVQYVIITKTYRTFSHIGRWRI